MYKGKRIIAIICARGGSKGVRNKNTLKILRKPLIAYTIEQALACKLIDRVIVSTESSRIKKLALTLGAEVPLLRPVQLATDTATTADVLLHELTASELHFKEKYDILLTLQVTSPIRDPSDITQAINLLASTTGTKTVVSAVETTKNPYFNMVEPDQRRYARISKRGNAAPTRRQDAPEVYALNGSIYATWTSYFRVQPTFLTDKTRILVMPEDAGFEIDTPLDIEIVSFLLKRRLRMNAK